MRIMVVGSSALIGSAIYARLVADGHEVTGVSRNPSSSGLLAQLHVRLDVAKAIHAEDWRPLLKGIEAVVNCAGVLQDSPGESVRAVHVDGVRALFEACEMEGIYRVVRSILSPPATHRNRFRAPTVFSPRGFESLPEFDSLEPRPFWNNRERKGGA